MTEPTPSKAAATSKTEPALPRGFYPAYAPKSGETAKKAFPSAENLTSPQKTQAFLLKTARDVATSAYPAPFKLTRVSAEEERVIAEEDLVLLRQKAGRKVVHRPVAWVDGPLDWGLTMLVVLRGRSSLSVPGVVGAVTPATLEAWKQAQERVASWPKEVLSNKGYLTGPLRDGVIGRFFESRRKDHERQLYPHHRTTAESFRYESMAELSALRDRGSQLIPIQGAMANVQNYPAMLEHWNGSVRANPAWDAYRERVGAQRADLNNVLFAVLRRLREVFRNTNTTMPADLHGYFNLNNGAHVAGSALLQRVLRETTLSNNWSDPDDEAALRLAFGITAHAPFSTFDLLCHAPEVANINASALTIKDVADLAGHPTVRWADGSEFYVYDGVEINPKVIVDTVASPKNLLNVRNVEQRRLLLRIVGTANLLKDVKSKLVSEDDFGALHQLPNGSQFVIVKNATPEPDGSVREYVLGTVGNSHRTARSGVASTWGLTEAQYWPTKET